MLVVLRTAWCCGLGILGCGETLSAGIPFMAFVNGAKLFILFCKVLDVIEFSIFIAYVFSVYFKHVAVSSPTIVCPEGYAYTAGGCYLKTTETYTWMDAAIACHDLGGTLATISSQAENRWVFEHLRSEGETGSSIWIGINDISSIGTYQWIDGNTSTFRNWISGQPNNAGGAQNCGVLWQGYQGQWGVVDCSSSFSALCKWEQNQPALPQRK